MCAAFLDRPNWPIRTTGGCNDGSLGRSNNAAHILCSPLVTTRGGTSPDGVEMTLIRERKSTHSLGPPNVNKLYDILELQAATVKIKVVRRLEAITLPSGIKRADFLVADRTGSIQITLWEQNIQNVVLNTTYLLQNIFVRSYRGKVHLSRKT